MGDGRDERLETHDDGTVNRLEELDESLGDMCRSEAHYKEFQLFLDVMLAPAIAEGTTKARVDDAGDHGTDGNCQHVEGGIAAALRAVRTLEAHVKFEKSVFSALGVADLKQERAELPVATA